ncbi:MAG: SHOCT domain-containing protein [Chloroflexi bacterium]|nr:SHOCT domain-containing protein [Chloroflexota bacterium]
MDMQMNPAMWAMMGLWSFTFVAFWAAIIALAVWAINRLSPSRDASRLLEERYARGEISREEFLHMKEDLKG